MTGCWKPILKSGKMNLRFGFKVKEEIARVILSPFGALWDENLLM